MKECFIIILLLIGAQSRGIGRVGGYEMKVFNEIFGDLVEVMGSSSSFETPPPPMPSLDNNNPIMYDTVGYGKKIVGIERKDRKTRDTTFVIAIFDTLFTCCNLSLDVEYIGKRSIEPGYTGAFNSMNKQSIQSRPLDLSEIGNRKRFILKYTPESPEGFKT